MDRPGPVICMYVCVGTVSHAFEPTDILVVALAPFVEISLRTELISDQIELPFRLRGFFVVFCVITLLKKMVPWALKWSRKTHLAILHNL